MTPRKTPGTDDHQTPERRSSKARHIRFEWAEFIRHSSLPPLARHAAHVLAEHVGRDGRCFVSNKTLATEMGYRTEKSAKDAKAILIAHGCLVVVEKGGGAGRASVVEVRMPTENQVEDYPESIEEPVTANDESGYASSENRVPTYPPTEDQQKYEQTTTAVSKIDDDSDGRSMVAWMVLDALCVRIDGGPFTDLPVSVRRESLRLVSTALGVHDVSVVEAELVPPKQVTNKLGLVIALARKVAAMPVREEGGLWHVAG